MKRQSNKIENEGRSFYYGNTEAADELAQLLPVANEIAQPGDRLVVGTGDLRKTPLSEAFLYYLLPQTRPGTYYIEMDPGVANADDSQLADDLRKADLVIRSRRCGTSSTSPTTPRSSARPSRTRCSAIASAPCSISRLYELLERCDRVEARAGSRRTGVGARARARSSLRRCACSCAPRPTSRSRTSRTPCGASGSTRRPSTCSSSTTTAPTGRPTSPSASRRSSGRSTCCAGPRRRASARRTAPASPSGSSAGTTCSSRWTPTSRTTPSRCPALLQAIDDGADLVIGSRYVPGGSIPHWPWHRRALSKWGNAYSGFMLACGLHDMTSGFRAYRRETLEAVDYAGTRAVGYGFQIELAYRVSRAGGKVVETPITFTDRERGHSKMSPAVAFEELWLVTWWSLRDRPWWRKKKRQARLAVRAPRSRRTRAARSRTGLRPTARAARARPRRAWSSRRRPG